MKIKNCIPSAKKFFRWVGHECCRNISINKGQYVSSTLTETLIEGTIQFAHALETNGTKNLKINFCLLKAVDGWCAGGAAALGMYQKSAYSDFLKRN